MSQFYEVCPKCAGTGKEGKHRCYNCGGKGQAITQFGEELLRFIGNHCEVDHVPGSVSCSTHSGTVPPYEAPND